MQGGGESDKHCLLSFFHCFYADLEYPKKYMCTLFTHWQQRKTFIVISRCIREILVKIACVITVKKGPSIHSNFVQVSLYEEAVTYLYIQLFNNKIFNLIIRSTTKIRIKEISPLTMSPSPSDPVSFSGSPTPRQSSYNKRLWSYCKIHWHYYVNFRKNFWKSEGKMD